MHRPSYKPNPHSAQPLQITLPMCKIHITSLHHESTPKPTSSSTQTPFPTQRSNLQKHHRKMSLPGTFCLSSASAALTPSTTLTSFPNHYEAMQLTPSACTEDVKAQFRTLRGEYFACDAGKYRQLQTAYAVLVDSEARREYDELYGASMGLPRTAGETGESSGSASASLRKSALVKAAVSRIDAQAQEPDLGQRLRAEEELRLRREQEEAEEEEEGRRQREADPNYGLKHFSQVHAPLIGSQPYHSYVPVAAEYEGGKRTRRSRRPMYVGELAAKAVP
ncbi:hypothetical protein PMIN02_009412 [Paraphaeosphaeria minitans]